MAETQIPATPQQARKSYPALVAKAYWLQAKRFVEAPFLSRISSTRSKNRMDVSAAWEERGDARDARGKHLNAAKLYAQAMEYYSAGDKEKRIGLLEKQVAALEKAEKSCDDWVRKWGSRKDAEFESLFVEVADDYFKAAELRMKLASAFFDMIFFGAKEMRDKAKTSLDAATSDFKMAEALYKGHSDNCRFMADKARELREKAEATLSGMP